MAMTGCAENGAFLSSRLNPSWTPGHLVPTDQRCHRSTLASPVARAEGLSDVHMKDGMPEYGDQWETGHPHW